MLDIFHKFSGKPTRQAPVLMARGFFPLYDGCTLRTPFMRCFPSICCISLICVYVLFIGINPSIICVKCYTFPNPGIQLSTYTCYMGRHLKPQTMQSISKDLGWNTHTNRISTNANRTLGFLKRNIKTKNTAIRTSAYQTLVRPQVEYASTVWSPFTHIYINKIEMVQGLCAGSTATIPHMPV